MLLATRPERARVNLEHEKVGASPRDAEAFEIWHPRDDRAELVDDRVVWQPEGTTAAFELDVRGFFASIADDAPLP